jgi:hypothetical protein
MSRSQKLADQGLSHSLKKAAGSRKRKKHTDGDTSTTAETSQLAFQTPSTQVPGTSAGIKNPSTAMLTARVLEDEMKKRQRRGGANENLQSLFSKSSDGGKMRDGDFMTRGYTIPAGVRR